MAVQGISGLGITGTLSNGEQAIIAAQEKADESRFMSLIQEMTREKNAETPAASESVETVASSQIASNHRLKGDYTEGFYNYYTSEKDKNASPEGMAANAVNSKGKKVTIDRTSELYAQSKELENYMMKMMLSSMRDTIHHTSLFGKENDFARGMYEDMLYDNYAEALTKNTNFGLADQIYLELSGLRA
ncbi:MAG: rod-binding protein [Treponema sp.]|nr:rod-binding protein [Treponema sp.]MBR4005722.1 rod-binding protein [Treponema sp.]